MSTPQQAVDALFSSLSADRRTLGGTIDDVVAIVGEDAVRARLGDGVYFPVYSLLCTVAVSAVAHAQGFCLFPSPDASTNSDGAVWLARPPRRDGCGV